VIDLKYVVVFFQTDYDEIKLKNSYDVCYHNYVTEKHHLNNVTTFSIFPPSSKFLTTPVT